MQLKSYKYQFKLLSQVLTGAPAGGQIILSTAGGQGPIGASNIVMHTGSCGLTNFYDFSIGVNFRLKDIVNYATFASMYDAYKIGKVGLELSYLNNVASQQVAGFMPTSYMYWDQDDATPPPSLSSIQGKQGVKIRQFGQGSKITQRFSCRPVTAGFVQSSAGTANALIANKSQWLDCLNPDVNHYAIKIFITDLYLPVTTTSNQAFKFQWTYNVAFRSPLLTS